MQLIIPCKSNMKTEKVLKMVHEMEYAFLWNEKTYFEMEKHSLHGCLVYYRKLLEYYNKCCNEIYKILIQQTRIQS